MLTEKGDLQKILEVFLYVSMSLCICFIIYARDKITLNFRNKVQYHEL